MHKRTRRALQISALLLAMASSIVLTAWWARHSSMHALSNQESEQLRLRALALQRLVDRYRVLPSTLALDPTLRTALQQPRNQVDTRALNRKLERINGATHISTLTLIDRDGIAIAASNWREPSSNVGRNYAFRPYFQRAMHNGIGTFYAIGVSTHVPGYFIAQAIHDDKGRRIGVIVVKITLQKIIHEWSGGSDIILLSDDHGIVFLSNHRDWQYRPLHRLGFDVRSQLNRTRQYTNHLLSPARLQPLHSLDDGGQVVRVDSPGPARSMLERSLSLPAQGWTIRSLSHIDAVTAAMYRAGLIVLGGWLPLILLWMFLRQRLHLATVRQRSREELERLVAYYTGALRSEQNSLVQAALQAANGHPEKLEDIPQGVSVVDADLRLVAWNRRYAETFQYPDRLLYVHCPVEDLLRYNARHGMLGEGDSEEAIGRRLDYLREGGPYIHERERIDGSVLEIRGNPLPGGGFVTSYADITPYKKAARALRTLTTTLEHRVQKSTRELRAAKAEAERANRNKTRYVAAAVHDLLQPLNAARLFSGALRKALHQPRDQAVLDRIEQSLQALDDQLGSMLDLSRLEAGATQPEIRDMELAPLLQSLARQFGIIARARGLSLHLVNTRAWVRSDPMLLRRIVQNFLSNALHYTPHGGIVLGCRRRGANLRLEVWDTGVGIPADKRDAIFDEFARLDTGLDSNERRAGLGLSIVKRIAGLLHHPLALRSWPGRGSVFSVELPRTQVPVDVSSGTGPSSDEDHAISPLAGRHILCVDDDPESVRSLATVLRSWSCHVHAVRDENEVRTLEASCIDLIVLQYRLGDQCGLDLLPGLRARLGHLPPVIVLAAKADADTRRRIRESGLHFLAKPPSPASLRAMMSQLLVAASRP